MNESNVDFGLIDKLFVPSYFNHFPVSECTIQSDREPNVYYGAAKYMVLAVNSDNSAERKISVCTPYVYRDADVLYLGWADCYWKYPYGNLELSCLETDFTVVGFRRLHDDTK